VINAGRTAYNSVVAPVKDIMGAARPTGGGVELGAYEAVGN
jgi:hypothetical protein